MALKICSCSACRGLTAVCGWIAERLLGSITGAGHREGSSGARGPGGQGANASCLTLPGVSSPCLSSSVCESWPRVWAWPALGMAVSLVCPALFQEGLLSSCHPSLGSCCSSALPDVHLQPTLLFIHFKNSANRA